MTNPTARKLTASQARSLTILVDTETRPGRKTNVRRRPYGIYQIDSRDVPELIAAGYAERDDFQVWTTRSGRNALSLYNYMPIGERVEASRKFGCKGRDVNTVIVANGCGL